MNQEPQTQWTTETFIVFFLLCVLILFAMYWLAKAEQAFNKDFKEENKMKKYLDGDKKWFS